MAVQLSFQYESHYKIQLKLNKPLEARGRINALKFGSGLMTQRLKPEVSQARNRAHRIGAAFMCNQLPKCPRNAFNYCYCFTPPTSKLPFESASQID